MTVFMEQHYERMHNKDKQGICEQCGRVFPNSYMLKIHIKSEHDDPERFHCDICKGVFRSKYNLQKHIKIIHIDKAIACPICQKVLTLQITILLLTSCFIILSLVFPKKKKN